MTAVMSAYRLGAWYVPPLVPFRMMVVDVSPCRRYVTFASGGRYPVEITLVLKRSGDQLKPRFSDRV